MTKKSKIHSLPVWFNCDCCGGYQYFPKNIYVHSNEEPEQEKVNIFKIDDLEGNKVVICPRCAVKGLKIMIQMIKEK